MADVLQKEAPHVSLPKNVINSEVRELVDTLDEAEAVLIPVRVVQVMLGKAGEAEPGKGALAGPRVQLRHCDVPTLRQPE